MAIITQPVPNSGYNQTLYGMTSSEAKTILPLIKRGYNHAVKMVEHYADLTTDGYGTERQTTALMKWQDKADTLAHILNYIDDSAL